MMSGNSKMQGQLPQRGTSDLKLICRSLCRALVWSTYTDILVLKRRQNRAEALHVLSPRPSLPLLLPLLFQLSLELLVAIRQKFDFLHVAILLVCIQLVLQSLLFDVISCVIQQSDPELPLWQRVSVLGILVLWG